MTSKPSAERRASGPEMPKAYDPGAHEDAIYRRWLEGSYFRAEIVPGRKPFTIIMPPPNVTGELHQGHAMFVTIEDILTRWHRMLGDPTLWLPGVDHAGIATQNVVERELMKEGLTRHEIGREEFIRRVWKWVERSRSQIDDQLRKLGASCDWSREVFTLDERPAHAVRQTFVNMYRDGLIYRGERIINWCPRCQTALSDLEVEHKEHRGHLWHLRYPVLDDEGRPTGRALVVATTRPETFVGDTGVAVHPEDERYGDLVGRRALLPVIERELRIVADEAVDREFGTGAVKVTPGHDPTDFEIGQRHGLPVVNAMTLDGRMGDAAGPYAGLDRLEARRRIVEDLERLGYLVKVEDYTHSIGHCQRCDTVVEPLVSNQWWVKMKPLAEPAIQVVRDGRIRIIPERFEKIYLHWMENIRDWCISRQLWWGHRIPVWYCASCDGDRIHITLRPGAPTAERGATASYRELRERGLSHDDIERNIDFQWVDRDASPIVAMEAPGRCERCGGTDLVQDADVLDTWFSSALWTHSTLGRPHETEDLRYFYPTSVMETGYDILFFWVARMIMMGLYNMGEVPFHTVYLHGLVRDAEGEKISKSRIDKIGKEVADPREAIKVFGCDALRFSLATGSTPGNDMRLSIQRMEMGRNFANKLWNAARFVVTSAGGAKVEPAGATLPPDAPPEDRWILSRAGDVARLVNDLLRRFEFGEAGRQVYDFFWNEYADWYIEMAKIRLRDEAAVSPLPVLVSVLETVIRLLHPYMPFVTEAIWQNLKGVIAAPATEDLIVAPYPTGEDAFHDEAAEREIETVIDVVRAIRNIRSEKRVEPARYIEAYVAGNASRPWLERGAAYIEALARARPLRIVADVSEAPREQVATAVLRDAHVVVPLAGLFDIEAERARLSKQLADAEAEVARLEAKLANEQFRARAPREVVAKEEEKLADARARARSLRARVGELG
ncbi:MAG TPA: valine--tRNA ligase [Dehalococcoidia bacterium]|nr:valine--tRNA ligase [Dehalococcoidia bacterium]